MTDPRNAPIARGIEANWKVLVLPNWSANDPPVNEPTVAPASSVLTIQPVHRYSLMITKRKQLIGDMKVKEDSHGQM